MAKSVNISRGDHASATQSESDKMATRAKTKSQFCCINTLSYPYSIHILVFFIVNLKSSTLKMFIQKLCHRDKRGHRIAQIAAFAI